MDGGYSQKCLERLHPNKKFSLFGCRVHLSSPVSLNGTVLSTSVAHQRKNLSCAPAQKSQLRTSTKISPAHQLKDLVGAVHDRLSAQCFLIGDGPEAPTHHDQVHAGISRRSDVDLRVADVNGVLSAHAELV